MESLVVAFAVVLLVALVAYLALRGGNGRLEGEPDADGFVYDDMFNERVRAH